MTDIFISYRRKDSRADAGRLYDRLSARYGDDHVFMDIEDIGPGEDFVCMLEDTLASCDVLLALIGKRWLDGGADSSHLSDSGDFVRLEIETALRREIPVIPVLVGEAQMPGAGDLPGTLSDLSTRQAFQISDTRFHRDVDQLIADLEYLGGARVDSGNARKWQRVAAVAIALILLAGGALWLTYPRHTVPPLRNQPAALSVTKVKSMLVRRQFYDSRWNAAGIGTPNRFETRIIGDDFVVVDETTNLMWQKGGSGGQMGYDRTAPYIKEINEEAFGGFDDWRIPTLEEAMTLMEPTQQAGGHHVDPVFEVEMAPILWTADRAPDGDRWVLYFFNGYSDLEKPTFNAWVRAVRRAD